MRDPSPLRLRTGPARSRFTDIFCDWLLVLIGWNCVANGLALAGDWPRWRGPNLDGISTEKDWTDQWPAQGPNVLWQVSVGTGFSSVSVSQGRAYTMGNTGNHDTVFCFDAATGQVLWQHPYPCPLGPKYFDGGPTSTPTVDSNAVFTFSRQGRVFCFEAATGEVRWSKNLVEELGVPIPSWGFAGSPFVEDKLLLLNLGEAGTALDKANGKVVWTSANKDAGYSTPVPLRTEDDRSVVFGSSDCLVAVNAATGRELWRHRWATRYGVNAADVIVAGDLVFFSSGYNKGSVLLKLGGAKPEEVWKNKELRTQLNAAILLDGHLYGFDGDSDSRAKLKCLELKSGAVKWTQEDTGFGSLAAANGRLIVLTAKGELMVAPASPSGFKPGARAKVLGGKCWTVPVLSHGRLYCRNAAGDLVCLDVRPAR